MPPVAHKGKGRTLRSLLLPWRHNFTALWLHRMHAATSRLLFLNLNGAGGCCGDTRQRIALCIAAGHGWAPAVTGGAQLRANGPCGATASKEIYLPPIQSLNEVFQDRRQPRPNRSPAQIGHRSAPVTTPAGLGLSLASGNTCDTIFND
jgi:hypothetical protein